MLDTCSLDTANSRLGDTPLLPTPPIPWTPRYYQHPGARDTPVLRTTRYSGHPGITGYDK